VKKLVLLALAFALILTALSAAQALKGKAPDFTLPDLNGKNVKLSDTFGKGPVFISFWATWCGPCKKEIPELINVYNKYKEKGFEVLAISTDKTGQGTVKSFVEAHKIPYRILLDSSGEVFTRKYKGNGIPYGFLLDKDGTIVQSFYGYMPGFEENLSKKVEELLGSSSEKTAPPKEAETKK
jgi:peroxiredoxin